MYIVYYNYIITSILVLSIFNTYIDIFILHIEIGLVDIVSIMYVANQL